ncbi:MAG: rubrerythrin family protein [Clostridia bacterium]|nr:rubrerythrin family protein [Clostridia bacterium]
MELKGTKTEKNLWEAFAGESQARNKYDFFASQAKKDGYEKISEIFTETFGNEREHAKLWYKMVVGGKIKDTYQNLLLSAAGEKEEYTNMYKKMAEEAKAEGFLEIAKKFEGVAKIEKLHEQRFLAYAKTIKDETVFKSETEVIWKCRNCGHNHKGKVAPTVCPVCDHPQSYFEKI